VQEVTDVTFQGEPLGLRDSQEVGFEIAVDRNQSLAHRATVRAHPLEALARARPDEEVNGFAARRETRYEAPADEARSTGYEVRHHSPLRRS
jgi:hypothetical protein